MTQGTILLKKAYAKPKLEQVKLSLEEAVLAGCKISTGQPGVGGLDICGMSNCNLTFAS